jgi:hypothetical protein
VKKLIFAVLLAVGIMPATGCTAAQVTAAENTFHGLVVDAENSITTVENNEGNIDAAAAKAEAALSALAPQSAVIQKAIADAQAAWTAFKNNTGTVDSVLSALAVVDALTAPNTNSVPAATVMRKKKLIKPATPATPPKCPDDNYEIRATRLDPPK